MGARLRVLIVDDDPLDAELEVASLEEAGYSCEWELVSTKDEFTRRLREGEYDLVLSDYRMPTFDGVTALKIFNENGMQIPFILISGTVGEEVAIECLKAGATDYVLKTRLSRLSLVVNRALQEKEEQRKRLRAEEALRRAEEQFRHAQKMEAIGRLAGGVAHDFNNLLMVMLGYAELLQDALPAGELREGAHQIWNAGQKAASVTQQLLAFSRKQVVAAEILDLNAVITDMAKMVPRLIGEDIELTVVPGKELSRVKADRGHLEQVIMNLVVNARDAMPSGGKLRIEAANFTARNGFQSGTVPEGNYVRLSVIDSGTGMDPATLSRIFEPFFTTKEVGKGTGLGLATVYGIVRQNDGHIQVESEPARGTSFHIYLPVCADKVAQSDGAAAHGAPPNGRETILVVEDEEGVRSLVMAVLQSRGYKLLEAANPADALRLAQSHGGQINLLITDVVLPQMSGRELAEKIRAQKPDTKILFMSGYADERVLEQNGLLATAPFLQKPFSTDTLAWKVRELLDAEKRPAAMGAKAN